MSFISDKLTISFKLRNIITASEKFLIYSMLIFEDVLP